MAARSWHAVDAEAMERALRAQDGTPAGIVLALAWLAGLTRREIHALTWDMADTDARLLRLPDREIPLEAECAGLLERFREKHARYGPYIAVSERHKHMAIQSMTALARAALDAAGMPSVSLKDLRCDYIRRQLLEHDWPYVLRISGLSVENYRASFAGSVPERREKPERAKGAREEDEYRVWRIMQTAEESQVRLSLWLVQQMGLQLRQISALTWDDVDLAAGELRADGTRLPMPRGVQRVLTAERAARGPDDDPHVILSPRARAPVTPQRLSVLLRSALIRGGVEDLSMLDIRCGAARRVDDTLLLDHVARQGDLTTKQAAALLNMPERAARGRLRALTERGELVCVGVRYYSAKTTPPASRQAELVLALAEEEGAVRAQTAAEALRIPPRQAGRLLKRMVEQGILAREPGSVWYRAAEAEEGTPSADAGPEAKR